MSPDAMTRILLSGSVVPCPPGAPGPCVVGARCGLAAPLAGTAGIGIRRDEFQVTSPEYFRNYELILQKLQCNFNYYHGIHIIKKRRVVEKETAGARWWDVRFVYCDGQGGSSGGSGWAAYWGLLWRAVVSVKGPTFSGPR